MVTKPGSLEVFAQGTNNTLSMIAKLKPEENPILAGDDDRAYTVSSFQFNKSGAEELCPRYNCEYDIENGRYRTSVAAGEYVFDGRLKATITEDNTNKSEYYDMYANLRKVGSEETPSKLTEILEGDIGFQGRTSTPEIRYQILNGTLEVDEISSVLTLQGAK